MGDDVNFTRIWGQCFKIYTKIRLGSSFPNAEEDEKFAFEDTEMIVISRDLWVHLLLMFCFVSQIIHICTNLRQINSWSFLVHCCHFQLLTIIHYTRASHNTRSNSADLGIVLMTKKSWKVLHSTEPWYSADKKTCKALKSWFNTDRIPYPLY